jgi:hypothetical protein
MYVTFGNNYMKYHLFTLIIPLHAKLVLSNMLNKKQLYFIVDDASQDLYKHYNGLYFVMTFWFFCHKCRSLLS